MLTPNQVEANILTAMDAYYKDGQPAVHINDFGWPWSQLALNGIVMIPGLGIVKTVDFYRDDEDKMTTVFTVGDSNQLFAIKRDTIVEVERYEKSVISYRPKT